MNFRNLYPLALMVFTLPVAALVGIVSVRARADDKDFKPIVEADMPAGFPEYTNVGEVKTKRYPGYRKAETDVARSSAFPP